jgi:hypothetical protein
MPISRNCFCPWESSPAGGRARCQAQQNQHLIDAVAAHREFCPQARPDGFIGFHGDLQVFPHRQRFKTVGFWNLPDPWRAMAAGSSAVRSMD